LADGILDAYRKDDIIRKFLTNTSAPEIDIDVKKVALEDMQTPPYKARVDFYMVYYSPADHSEIKRDLYTANFVFVFKNQVSQRAHPHQPAWVDDHVFFARTRHSNDDRHPRVALRWRRCPVNREEQHDRNALILTIAILLALSFWLMGELKFLIPYKAVLIHAYGTRFSYSLQCCLRISLPQHSHSPQILPQGHSRKLSHLDKQMQVGQGELPAPSIDTVDGNNEELS